jgi:hypothetical protein
MILSATDGGVTDELEEPSSRREVHLGLAIVIAVLVTQIPAAPAAVATHRMIVSPCRCHPNATGETYQQECAQASVMNFGLPQ